MRTYIIKGKQDWSDRYNWQTFLDLQEQLKKELNSLIGIPADRQGRPMWMSYDEAVFQQQWIAERDIEVLRRGPFYKRAINQDPSESAKPLRDIDREVMHQIRTAESEGKDLIIFKKRHRHE